MAKFVYIYKGGSMPESEEEGKKQMEAWTGWLGGMGDHVLDAGAPFGASSGVNGGSTSGLSGYSVVAAASLDEAAEHAKGCPIFAGGGGVEVYEALEM
jgi:Uncharacterized protein conserved in bacteria